MVSKRKHNFFVLLVLLLILSAIGAHFYLNNFLYSVMPLVVGVSILLLRFAFPKFFLKRYNYVIIFISLFFILNIWVLLYDQYLEYKLAQFDINHDLVFSSQEQTMEQKEYMAILVNDLGRNLMPITSVFTSLFITFLFFLIVSLFKFISKRISPYRRTHLGSP